MCEKKNLMRHDIDSYLARGISFMEVEMVVLKFARHRKSVVHRAP